MFAVLGQPWRTCVSECSEDSDKTGVSPRTPAPQLGAGEGLVRRSRRGRNRHGCCEMQRDTMGQRRVLG